MNTPFRGVITMSAVWLLSLQGLVGFQAAPHPTHSYDEVFDPMHQRLIETRKDDMELRVPACSNCADVGRAVIINGTKLVSLAQELIDGTKAFIVDRYSNDINVVTLLDLVKGSVIDRFRCLEPTVSPDASAWHT
jgi:hypothetical protein